MYRRLHQLNNIRLRSTTSVSSCTSCSAHRGSSSALSILQSGEADLYAADPLRPSASGSTNNSWKNVTKHDPSMTPQQGRRVHNDMAARYIGWHERGELEKIKSLKPEDLHEIAQNSHFYTQDNLLTYLIEDILSLWNDGGHYPIVLHSILCAISNSTRKIDAKDVVSIFVAFARANGQDVTHLPPLSADTVKMTFLSIAQVCQGQEIFRADVTTLKALAHYLDSLDPSEIAAAEITALRFLIQISYRLLNQKLDLLVLRLVQILVRSEVIPSSLTTMDEEVPNDFRVLTVSLLIRTCFHHGWFAMGLNFLRKENLQLQGAELHYKNFIDKLILSLLPERPHLCSKVIVSVIDNNPKLRISEKILKKFFTSAYKADNYTAAKDVYATLRSLKVRNHVNYGIPPSPVATWLLQAASTDRNGRIIGKTLARHILELPTKITPYDRAVVVGACANAGYYDEAEELWRSYTSKAGRDLVAGHAVCMLSIVKSFNKICLNVISENSSSIGNGEAIAASFDSDLSTSLGGCQAADETAIPGEHVASDSEDCQLSLLNEIESYEHERGPDDVTVLSAQVPQDHVQELGTYEQMRANKLRDFVVEVYDAFKQAKLPLRYASHYDLNAIARAANELGLVQQSIYAIRAIIARKEVPDKYDLNVTISAMAKRKPEEAVPMLRKMAIENLQVDGQLLSTVIHEALNRGNLDLATRVFDLAMRYLSVVPTAAAGHRLLNAWLALHSSDGTRGEGSTSSIARRLSTQEEKDRLRLSLANAAKLLEQCDTNGSLRRKYLERCIAASLQAEDGGLAFRMWRMRPAGMRGKSEEAKAGAKAIAQQIRDNVGSGRIGLAAAAEMLSKLEREK